MPTPGTTRRGHRRPWWQFNLISLALALFALVYLRHFAELGFTTTVRSITTIGTVWAGVGIFGLIVRALGKASRPKRQAIGAAVAIVGLLGGLAVYPLYRQASLVTQIWTVDGSEGGGNTVVFARQELNAAIKDPLFWHRCFGRITEIGLWNGADAFDLASLATCRDLKELGVSVAGGKLQQLSGLKQVRLLHLTVDGPADFSQISHLSATLKRVDLSWRNVGDATLESLAGFPIGALSLSCERKLSEGEFDELVKLPLTLLYLEGDLVTSELLGRLRAARPGLRIIPRAITDHPDERSAVKALQLLGCELTANASGRVQRVAIFQREVDFAVASAAAKLPALKAISLRSAKLDDAAWAYLLESLDIKAVHVYECELSTAAWRAIGRLPNLEELRARETNLDATVLAELRRSVTLRKLSIGKAAIGQAEMKELVEFTQLSDLFFYEWISDLRVNELRAALPDTRVTLREQ